MANYVAPASPEKGKMTGATPWAFGVIFFAGTVMTIVGVFQVAVGLVAVIQPKYYAVSTDYAYKMDVSLWGWIHMAVGALAVATGFFLFFGKRWAGFVAIGAALLSAVSNFFFIPYNPIWSMLLIALDVIVIWAVAAHGRELNF